MRLEGGMSRIWIDHVVRGVGDLDAAGRRLDEEFGLASVAGGRHPAWGTGNRIVPLGRDYIELLGVVDEGQAAASPVGRGVREAVAGGDRWLCWCVATDDLDETADRLGLEVDRGSRLRPDGTMIRWRSAGFPFALGNGALPFFIAWEVSPTHHPGRAEAPHRAEPLGISWVEVGDDPRLAQWLGDGEIPVRAVDGAKGLLAVGLTTAAGEVALR
jgi:hypothetical protein